ncbi:hypothetical protein F4821DRAFT_251185 [Hypoxylon rubiginosum]|uniref:Uncharacterized protein n=1 Tax=Hypoxylon rubiginosum TaxID=110542 RepID=A0ACC0CJM6_9PEZI|nr:hypothetical protein F4821DRAFT_251185 [Hypoxylon rubiginosum]
MRFISLVGLGHFTAVIYALGVTDRRHDGLLPPIYMLSTTQPALTSLSKALDTLGYMRADSELNPSNQTASPYTYVEVSSSIQLEELSMSHPEAKFIIPGGKPSRNGDEFSIQQAIAHLGDEKHQHVFHLDVLSRKAATQADNWIHLCEFLGLGYSTVERLKLWHFPE